MPTEKRIIAVHAHPDDEVTSNGWTFPGYADDGVHITLVTCNLGEEGEVLVPELELLAASHANALGGYRMWELRASCEALGVSEHHFLGGAGRYRDSGMMGEPTNDNPRCFWKADLDEAASHLVKIIRAGKPQVLLTYNEFGGYGHPDHIQAHRVAMRGAELAADATFAPELGEPWDIAKIYWSATPRSAVQKGIDTMIEMGEDGLFGMTDAKDAVFCVDDELVTTQIFGSPYADRRRQALRAHATQVSLDHPFFKFLDSLGPEAHCDFYQLVKGTVGPRDPESGFETDLFAGL